MSPLGISRRLVAVADLLGQVLRQVADAPGRILRAREHALSVEPLPDPRHVERLMCSPMRNQVVSKGRGRGFYMLWP